MPNRDTLFRVANPGVLSGVPAQALNPATLDPLQLPYGAIALPATAHDGSAVVVFKQPGLDGRSDTLLLELPADLTVLSPVSALAIDPRAPATLYASTSEGLFKSTDGGERWMPIGAALPFAGAYLRAIAINPADSRIVYAASQRGFWKSIDGGANWTASNRGLGTDPYVNSLSVDSATGMLYADVFRAGIGVGR